MHAAAQAAAYACGGNTTAEAYTIAEATAALVVSATAQAAVGCEVSGTGTGSADAYGKATREGEAWLEAYAEAFAEAGVCDTCEATTYSWGYVEKHVVLKAMAEAKASVWHA